MQSKIIAGLFGLLWTGVCYQAGRVSQQQKNQTFTTEKVQIEHPYLRVPQSPKNIKHPRQLSLQQFQQLSYRTHLLQASSSHHTVQYHTLTSKYFTLQQYFQSNNLQSQKCPLAVYEHVTKQIAHGDAPRRSTFFNQPSIQPQFQSTNDHFIKSGAYKNYYLARGHMAAAGNYSGNKQAKFQTFTYANVIPQNQYNNAGIWNTFQRYSRDLVMSGKCDSVDIVSGPIYNKSQPFNDVTLQQKSSQNNSSQSSISTAESANQNNNNNNKVFKQQSLVLLQNGIVVPQKLYKIIQCNTNNSKSYIDAFEFWNKKTFDNQKPLKQFKTSISSVEKQTGLKFGFGEKDPLTGKLKLPQSLVQFDKEGFQKMKKSYDQKFYFNLMQRSTTINGMNGSFYRAKQQHIYIPLQQLSQQINQLFNKQIKQISFEYSKNKQHKACQSLNKLIKLNKDLFYLRQLKGEYEESIRRVEDGGVMEECYKKVGWLRAKGWDELGQEGGKLNGQQLRKEKVALNSLTHAITKQQLKRQQITKSLTTQQLANRNIFHFVNQHQLNDKFIIPVNVQMSINEQQ